MDGRAEPDVAVNHWTVVAEESALGTVRRELLAFASQHGMTSAAGANIAAATGEALENAARHAYPARESGPVIVDAATDDVTLTVRVRDQGAGEFDDDDYAGRGVQRMTALSDRIELSDGAGEGVCVLMEFALSGASPAALGGRRVRRARCS